jgi:hypothetical protein
MATELHLRPTYIDCAGTKLKIDLQYKPELRDWNFEHVNHRVNKILK